MTGEVIVSDIDPKKLAKSIRWNERIAAALRERYCVICGSEERSQRLLTCSDKCHDQMKKEFIEDFGEYKDITDMTTGLTHRVPTEEIFDKGLRQQDLKYYPVVE